VDNYRPGEQNRTDVAHIGKSVVIKGELSGSEDLFLDGEVEGSIELHDHNLTIGPNGRVRANINAKEVVIQGKVDGSISGSDRVELRKSGVLVGDIVTQRIIIEDGAYFKGGIDIRKDNAAANTKDRLPQRESANASTSTPVTPVTTPSSSLMPGEPVSSTRG
jgi:cytoskeletal protein CcmA (bactofilin family)